MQTSIQCSAFCVFPCFPAARSRHRLLSSDCAGGNKARTFHGRKATAAIKIGKQCNENAREGRATAHGKRLADKGLLLQQTALSKRRRHRTND